jgi:hypothetical protein
MTSRHDVDAQHEREMAALRAEIHELADALLRVTGGMQEIAAVLQVPNDVPVIDCVIKALAERDEALATVTVLREAALKLNDCLYGRCELCSFGGSCLKEEARNILANLPAAVTAWQAQREREIDELRTALQYGDRKVERLEADNNALRARIDELEAMKPY